MNKLLSTVTLCLALSGFAVNSSADINPGLTGIDHSHVDTSTGKIVSIMAQEQGIEFGNKEDRLDAEIVVTLDTKPGYLFGIRLHDGAQPATSAMIDLLKSAYFNNQPVSLFHVQAPGKKNVNVLRVELKH
jgi:hypothetical protein